MKYSIDPAELSDYDKLVQDNPSSPEEIQTLVREFDPDCVISLKWDHIYSEGIPHYLSAIGVFKFSGKRPINDILRFNEILNTTYIDSLRKYFETNRKSFHSME